MKAEYEAIVTLIPVFSDQRYSQINPNYIKILLDEEEQILKKSIGYLHKDIKHCLSELFNEYIKVDYELNNIEIRSYKNKLSKIRQHQIKLRKQFEPQN